MQIKFLDKVSDLYIVVLVIGFLFIGTVPKLLGISEASLSIQYRIACLGLSLFLIFKITFSRYVVKIHLHPVSLFFVFWFIYSIRIINDLYVNPIKLFPESSASEYSQFAFGVVLIPSIALVLIIQAYKIDLSWVLKWIYWLLLVTLSIALYSRAGSNIAGRTAGDINVGIILFGQFGASLSILSVYCLAREKHNIKNTLSYVFGFIVGFMGIFVSASKSPFLTLLIVLLLFFVLWYGNVKSAILIAALGMFLSLYFIEIISFLNQYFNSNFLDRLLYSIDVGGDKAREGLVNTAFIEFLDNPFFGNAMLIQADGMAGSYPHNLIIEAFMATGIVGGGIFVFWIIKCLKVSIKAIKKHSEISWVALLFLQYLIFGMFSKNLYANDLFWFFSILVVTVEYEKIRRIQT